LLAAISAVACAATDGTIAAEFSVVADVSTGTLIIVPRALRVSEETAWKEIRVGELADITVDATNNPPAAAATTKRARKYDRFVLNFSLRMLYPRSLDDEMKLLNTHNQR
jgi:hypothetical protein